jgi:membrane protein
MDQMTSRAEICGQAAGNRAGRSLFGKGWLVLARRTLVEAARDRVTSSAASLAFHWFLAIFPATIVLVSLSHLIGLSGDQLGIVVHDVNVVLPVQAASVIDQALRAPVSSRADAIGVVVGAVAAIWGGVEAMAALQIGLDVAFEVAHDRGFLRRRLMALPLLALTVVLGGSGFTLVVLGAPVGKLIAGSVPIAGEDFAMLWGWFRWVAALFLVMLLLSSYYALGPAWQQMRWRWASAGSVLAIVSWLGASVGFSFYLDHFGHESRTYGPFAGVAVLMLWLLVAAVIVLLGAELDCELGRSSSCSAPSHPDPERRGHREGTGELADGEALDAPRCS